MSRIATGDVVKVKPTSNIYTVLAVVGLLVAILGFVVLYMTCEAKGVKLF